jgi:hypothetical protein
MLNCAVDHKLLDPLVPRGLELDQSNSVAYVSVVGFLFLKTRVFGIPVPFHRNFDEVNLRFYLRHRAPDGWRSGVVFVREIVPRRVIASLARRFYSEPYSAFPMTHAIERDEDVMNGGGMDGANSFPPQPPANRDQSSPDRSRNSSPNITGLHGARRALHAVTSRTSALAGLARDGGGIRGRCRRPLRPGIRRASFGATRFRLHRQRFACHRASRKSARLNCGGPPSNWRRTNRRMPPWR